jgi:hypothetical protein
MTKKPAKRQRGKPQRKPVVRDTRAKPRDMRPADQRETYRTK